MPVPANLVHEISTSTGTGNFTLSAQNGKQRFSTAFGTGVTLNVFDYFISNQDAAEWERGTGHMSATGTLVRDTVIESTNANAAVNFSAGTKNVTNDVPAGHQVRAEAVIPDNAIVRGDGGAAGVQSSGITIDDSNNMFLPTGTKIDWAAGDATITHSANALAFAGAANGYSFDQNIKVAATKAIDFGAGDVTITHSTNALAFAGATNGYSFDAAVLGANGAVGTPSISFSNDPDTGLYSISANVLGIAAGGVNHGIFSALQDQAFNFFAESGETGLFAGTIFRGSDPGSHTTSIRSLFHIENRPVGSGLNGPNSADYGQTISIVKQNFGLGTSAVTGEIDGLSIGVRQGGTLSDAGCILGNILHTGTGFIAFAEASVTLAPAPSFTVTRAMQVHIGSMNTPTDLTIGFDAVATTGALNSCFYVDSTGSATWAFLFRGKKLGTDVFTVDGNGNASVLRNDSNTTTAALFISQAGTGDAMMQYQISGVTAWSQGIDNSDSDSFKLQAAGDGFATAVVLRIDTTGQLQVSSGTIAANAAAGTPAFGNVLPTGGHTAVQEWLRINNGSGVARYIPMF